MSNTSFSGPFRPASKWWGWGDPNVSYIIPLETSAGAWLKEMLGLTGNESLPVPDPASIPLAPPRGPRKLQGPLTTLLGKGAVDASHEGRLFHAYGKSYRDLLRLRLGRVPLAPDYVVYPGSHEEVLQLLTLASEMDVAVVPFGGGSSVVGGVEAFGKTDEQPVLCVDLSRMRALLHVDPASLTARFQAGIFGPDLEAALKPSGLMLCHLPQSFEFSTLGGWVATRSAGQVSTGYGKIEEMVEAVRMATPAGTVETGCFPASACGPDWDQVVLGSEGTLGIITEAVVRVNRLPEAKDYRAYSFPSFEQGVEAARNLMQAGVPPVMLRLSDHDETISMLRLGSAKQSKLQANVQDLAMRGLRLIGASLEDGCMMLAGWEGEKAQVGANAAWGHAILKKHGGFNLGTSPAHRWEKDRFRLPYLRDDLMTHGILIDTLETATTWGRLLTLYHGVKRAIAEATGAKGLCFCHLSHLYPDGASLYFTFLARQDPDDPEGQWVKIKTAASDAIQVNHGTISHHHGVGYEHLPWAVKEYGPLALEMLRAAKERMDPKGIMNPRKLLPLGGES